jgi:hypothetical protein
VLTKSAAIYFDSKRKVSESTFMVRKLLACETVASGQSCEQGSRGIHTAWNGYLATPAE